MRENKIYYPKKWQTVLYALIVIFFMAPRGEFLSIKSVSKVSFMCFMIVSTHLLFSRFYVKLNEDSVEGPSGLFGKRIKINIEEIDVEKSNQSSRNFFRNKNGTYIYSKGGQRIIIAHLIGHKEYKEILRIIGLNI